MFIFLTQGKKYWLMTMMSTRWSPLKSREGGFSTMIRIDQGEGWSQTAGSHRTMRTPCFKPSSSLIFLINDDGDDDDDLKQGGSYWTRRRGFCDTWQSGWGGVGPLQRKLGSAFTCSAFPSCVCSYLPFGKVAKSGLSFGLVWNVR